jgi:pyridoxamine 5'-phosphate oxidase-like protein
MVEQSALRPQRRSRAIAMTPDEVDEFLTAERVCRLASIGSDGTPHVSPLWYVWHDQALWIYSIVRSQRWADITDRPTVSAVIDAGGAFGELRGVELIGNAEVVGEVPRVGQPCPELEDPERLLARKYNGQDTLIPDERHGWLRIRPTKVVSWDHRKSQRLSAPSG